MPFQNKTIWLTGASSGIGAALVRALAGSGARLILSARRADRLQALARDYTEQGGTALALPLDLEAAADLPGVVESALAQAGPIDILINNAGLGQRAFASELGPAALRRLLEVNFFGPVLLTQALLPHMLQRRSGQIAVTSSVLGKFGAPRRSAYCASKFALHGWFESLRAEVADRGIAVTLVCPGFVRTEISQHALEADGAQHERLDPGQAKGMDPDRFARKMLRAIEKRREEVFIGGAEAWAVQVKRLFPSAFSWALQRVHMD